MCAATTDAIRADAIRADAIRADATDDATADATTDAILCSFEAHSHGWCSNGVFIRRIV
jgi:hypothetical protein